jgi:5-(carboxyamino)imidazole ribonucleotide synthase
MRIGVLGGGQLGRMLALAGYPLGLEFRFLDPDPDCPAGRLGELVVGNYDDPAALDRFASGLDVVSYEFENVPESTAEFLRRRLPVFPPPGALAVSQDRVAEKRCFRALGINTPDFVPIDTRTDLDAAVARLGTPCVLKTRRFGYDGKGQAVIGSSADIDAAWAAVGGGDDAVAPAARGGWVLEAFVRFEREVSVIGVRGHGGGEDAPTALYPPIENVHSRGILSVSTAPSPGLSLAAATTLADATRRVMHHLDYVGVLSIEFFDLGPLGVLANEMAPRVHNSGHWTIEGSACSQFENHVRAVAGLPLGSTAMTGAGTPGALRTGTDDDALSVMYNIIGRAPRSADVLAVPGAHLHLYGKSERPGRKLGHVTLCGATGQCASLRERAAALEAVLARAGSRP